MSHEQPYEQPGPGWYHDVASGRPRWWDGTRWGPLWPPERPLDWRVWIVATPAAARLDRWVRNLDALGLAVAASLVVATLAVGHRLLSVDILFIPSFAVLVAGQCWVIALFWARAPRAERGRRFPPASWNPRVSLQRFFGGLSTSARAAVLGAFGAAWLVGLVGLTTGPAGTPSHARPGCPHALNDHGTIECVSRATYQRAEVGETLAIAGVTGGFFAFHLGATASELARRRSAPPPLPTS